MYLLRAINFKLNFIHPGIRYRILKLICKFTGMMSKNFEVDFFGKRYSGNLQTHIDFMTFFYGSYEIGILNYLRQNILKPEMVVLDVGANIGHHSLFFAAHCKKVYSFEPYAKVRQRLEDKIRLNHLNSVEIVPYGLSDQKQTLEYFEPPSENSGVGSFQPNHSADNAKSGLELELLRGDDFINSKNIEAVHFVKIDVEGFEHFVLRGLSQTLKKNRPVILMEFNKQTQTYCKNLETFKILFPENYRIITLNKRFSSLAQPETFDFHSKHELNLLCIPSELKI